MQRLLRHPISSIREPFGKAGLTVAILALVFAMVGGAYAAGGGLSGKQKTEVEKIAKKYSGKPGAAGATGPAGAAGAAGKKGAAGEAGEPGEAGVAGKAGTPGVEGSPWTAGGTLPSGASEQGSFAAAGQPGKFGPFEVLLSPVSFDIPLEVAPTAHVIPAPTYKQVETEPGVFEETEEVETFPTPPAGCKGNVEEPEAEGGNLCVFVRKVAGIGSPLVIPPGQGLGPGFANLEKAGTGGAVLLAPAGGPGSMFGTWVVTAQ